jgi:hypothetical protein
MCKKAFAESAVNTAVISRRSLLYKMIYLLTPLSTVLLTKLTGSQLV